MTQTTAQPPAAAPTDATVDQTRHDHDRHTITIPLDSVAHAAQKAVTLPVTAAQRILPAKGDFPSMPGSAPSRWQVPLSGPSPPESASATPFHAAEGRSRPHHRHHRRPQRRSTSPQPQPPEPTEKYLAVEVGEAVAYGLADLDLLSGVFAWSSG
ncbi:hypothetical protein ABZX74_17420 [Streptomyces olivaceoviridis]|uniref:hypothetical protein n=1 Tax=Streptomyces olivaceoviridis TaxID=1921 RepID=UPI0033A484F5